jgi:hypothetical protein
MELSTLVKHLCKVDTIVDNRYAEYRDTKDKYGDSKMLVDYYKQKYQKAKNYRESLKKRIFELEQSTKPVAVEPAKLKRKIIIDEEEEDEPPAKVAKSINTRITMKTQTRPSSQLYTPRKEVLTSAYGLKYRHDPDFREHVKSKQRERYERLKFLYV